MSDLPVTTFFELTRHDAVVEVCMNRPEKANGMSPEFWAELPMVMAALDADVKVRAVILSGAGKNFSGGMDLSTFQDLSAMVQAEPGRAAYAMRQKVLSYQRSLSFAGRDKVACHRRNPGRLYRRCNRYDQRVRYPACIERRVLLDRGDQYWHGT